MSNSGSNQFSRTHFHVMNYVAGIRFMLSMLKMSMAQGSSLIPIDPNGLLSNKNYNERHQCISRGK